MLQTLIAGTWSTASASGPSRCCWVKAGACSVRTPPSGLEPVESRSFPGAAVLAEYRTGAAIEPGSFFPDEPSEAELDRCAKLDYQHICRDLI